MILPNFKVYAGLLAKIVYTTLALRSSNTYTIFHICQKPCSLL